MRRSEFGLEVIECTGPEALPNAAERVLTDPNVAMAVIDDLVTPDHFVDPDEISRADREELFEYLRLCAPNRILPQVPKLDAVVLKWTQSATPPLKLIYPTLELTTLRTTGREPHIDYADPEDGPYGPLTLSVRIDNMPTARTFYAKRPKQPVVQQNGRTNLLRYSSIQADARLSQVVRRNFAQVAQKPGSGVLYANWPWPTIHAVDTPDFGTAAALYDYHCAAVG